MMMKKLNNMLITRLLVMLFQFILLILLITPCYCQDYTQQDLDQALKVGMSAYNSGDYNKVVEEFAKAVTISESLYGKEHTQTALYYNNLGLAYNYLSFAPLKAIDCRGKLTSSHLQ
jgi:hypothetical protein